MVQRRHKRNTTYALMTVNGFALEEMQSANNGSVVGVPFHHVGVTSSKVCRDEAERRVIVF